MPSVNGAASTDGWAVNTMAAMYKTARPSDGALRHEAQPLVDILMATYNGAKYLSQQLDSLLAQTHQNFRLLVSDDGSTDNTLALLETYRFRFGGRMVVVPYPHRGQGVVKNFENLMRTSLQDGLARSVAFCDQDDVWLPHKIERCLQVLRAAEHSVGAATPCLVHSDLTVVGEALQVLAPSFVQHQRMDPAACSALALLSINQVTGCTMMVNRALLELALPLPEETIMHDWWCAVVSSSGRRVFIAEALILYRQHGSNQLGAKDRSLRMRLLRLVTNGAGVLERVLRLGRATKSQAQALQTRLDRWGHAGGYVSEYLAWRSRPWWRRLLGYRRYYVGPELDRLSRCLMWCR